MKKNLFDECIRGTSRNSKFAIKWEKKEGNQGGPWKERKQKCEQEVKLDWTFEKQTLKYGGQNVLAELVHLKWKQAECLFDMIKNYCSKNYNAFSKNII